MARIPVPHESVAPLVRETATITSSVILRSGEFSSAQTPCPSTGKTAGACPGYVVDHVVPLERGAVDDPSNMQWQTLEDAKAKDRVED